MLEAHDITVTYGGRKILHSVNVTLKKGDCLALLGPSGSGKTTLLRVLSGLHKSDNGTVCCDGEAPSWPDPRSKSLAASYGNWLWPDVCLVFQDLRLFPSLSGLHNILIGGKDEQQAKVAADYVEQFGLSDCVNRRPRRLSQGEQQRVAIIRALVRSPRYLLLDEPTSSLDPATRQILQNVIRDLIASSEVGVLVATHDWEFASNIASSFLTIRNANVGDSKTLADAIVGFSASADKQEQSN